jgi:hypothetical protein
MASKVRKYFTQDLTLNEMKSYTEYVNGNENSTDWIEKALARREPLLLMQLKCEEETIQGICNEYVNIRETGICSCSKGHTCYNTVLRTIKQISSN